MNVTGTADSAGNVLYYEAYLDPVTSRGYNDHRLAIILIDEGLVRHIHVRPDRLPNVMPKFVYKQSLVDYGRGQSGQEFLAEANAKQKEFTAVIDRYYEFERLHQVHTRLTEDKR